MASGQYDTPVSCRVLAQVSDTADESLHGDENGQLAARLVSHNNLPSEPASRLMSRMVSYDEARPTSDRLEFFRYIGFAYSRAWREA